MKLVFLPLLLAVLGQGGDDPTVRMKAMEEKIAKADSLQVTVDSKIESSKGGGSIKGTLTVAGTKGHAEFAMDFVGKEMKMQMVSDGTKMATKQDGKLQPVKDTPKNFRSSMTVVLARAGFAALFLLARGTPQGEEEDFLETVKLGDIKKLKMEKIGDRETMVITYKLIVKDEKIAPTGIVWLDLKTNLPLKRELRTEVAGGGGETVTITETYSNFRINPKLDAKLFKLPE